MTLIELLVAIVILTTLVAAVIPAMTPTTSQRRIREAARGLNTFIATQQARALTGQRQMGIGLKRLSLDTGRAEDRGVCLEVYSVEQPPPFAGFDSNSAARVALQNDGTVRIELLTRSPGAPPQNGRPPGWAADILPAGVIRPGDVIEILGNRYMIAGSVGNRPALDPRTGYFAVFNDSTNQAATFIARPQNATGQAVVPYHDGSGARFTPESLANGLVPFWSNPARYKIHRQPAVTSASPYLLPEGIAIDLQGSGMMDDAPLYIESAVGGGIRDNGDMIFVMFSPDGSIGSIHYNRGGTGESGQLAVDYVTVYPTSSLSLLVGRRELIPVDRTLGFGDNPSSTELEQRKAQVNWMNLESAWVNIGYQTGSVITTDLANVNPIAAAQEATDYDRNNSIDPLDIRREQIMRSRAFARDLSRMGGK